MTSSRVGGAASAAPLATIQRNGATPALADQWEVEALDVLEAVQDPAEAEVLLGKVTLAAEAMRIGKLGAEYERRWKVLRLKAERRYGELLGPAEPGGNNARVTGSHTAPEERAAKARARKVADVPPDVFDAYVTDDPQPSREGLLRKQKPKVAPRPRPSTETEPAEAADLLRRRARQVRATDNRVRPRWTLEDAGHVELVLKHLLKRRPKYSGKRLRELAAKRQAGGGTQLIDLQYRMMQLTSMLESVDVATLDLADADEAGAFHDDLVELQLWLTRSVGLASARLDDAALERKIRKLRDTAGRTEGERRNAAALADNLEQRRRERRLAS